MKSREESADFIVIGAGSAGCALAHRLASDGGRDVILLEAGGPARSPLLHIPLGFAFLLKPNRNNWAFQTEPEHGLQQRRIDLPRGKVLGGCSAINGMVYVRGQAADFDRWAQLGNRGWAYRDVLPYFKRAEDCEAGADDYHGVGGPLWVGSVNTPFPICDAFIEAAEQAGHPRNPDFNAADQEGVGYFPANIKRGRRFSAARAFLERAVQPGRLRVLTGAATHRVLVEGGRATGVVAAVDGRPTTFRAREEVVLCAGAINSPRILEHSGIGEAHRLRRLGLPVVQNLPGVGENLHDHWNSYLVQRLARGNTYYRESRPWPMLRNTMRYLLRGESFLGNPAALVAVFYRALPDAAGPDAQIHFAPAASETDARGNLVPIDGVIGAACGLRPESRGATHIHTAEMGAAPRIQVNYLQTQRDRDTAIAAFRKMREIFAAPAMGAFGGAELEPGSGARSDRDILSYIQARGEPVHHLVGSCRMGSAADAVVDDRLRVHGIEGLRVADASIMPEIVSGNTHASCVMIGEKAADLMLGAATAGTGRLPEAALAT